MSKYEPLWEYAAKREEPKFTLSYGEIESLLGFAIDHSFLTYKKELEAYGCKVGKISMKEKTVEFIKL